MKYQYGHKCTDVEEKSVYFLPSLSRLYVSLFKKLIVIRIRCIEMVVIQLGDVISLNYAPNLALNT